VLFTDMLARGNWIKPAMVLFFFNLGVVLMDFLCVSQQGEFKNTIKSFLKKIHVKNFWPKKLRKKHLFSCRLFPSIFLIAFLAVSLHEKP
jgi:hypothetical protein